MQNAEAALTPAGAILAQEAGSGHVAALHVRSDVELGRLEAV